MPAAAVYVVAIVGTIGAAIAFKHFVFDPHVRPAVGRWIEALRQNQRRQRAPVEVADADEPEVSMRERRRSSHTNSTESSDDDEDNCVRPSSSHRDERGFPQRSGLPFESMSGMSLEEGMMPSSSIEMDILVAREVREWRDEIASSSGQDLRHRRPALGRVSGSGVLDESVHPIPYVPLSPRRTHVLFNSGSASPATPGVASRLPTIPTSPALVVGGGDIHYVPTATAQHSLPSPPQTLTSTLASRSTSVSGSDAGLHSPLPRRSVSGSSERQPRRLIRDKINLPPIPVARGEEGNATTARGGIPSHLSPLTGLSLSQLSPPPTAVSEEGNTSPYLQPQNIPSLSQSYPQDLDAEHGLELLSPPSSRADSPFSMADISPRPPMVIAVERSRALALGGPIGTISIGNGSTVSTDSSPARTPSRTLLHLGSDSFDTLSPAVGPGQLALRAASVGIDVGNNILTYDSSVQHISPLPSTISGQLLEPPIRNEPGATTPQSLMNSTGSTAFLSFSEEEDDDNVPLAVRRASLISNLSHSASPSRSQGLGLTFVPPILNASSHPWQATPPAPLSPSMLSPRSRLAQVPPPSNSDTAPFRALSDSDLSELDLISDFSPSEGELVFVDSPGLVNNDDEQGNAQTRNSSLSVQRGAYESDLESDASWSVAGGSDVGMPQSPRSGGSGVHPRAGGSSRPRHG